MVTKTQAVTNFLHDSKIKSLFAPKYHYGMECQVNVAQDGGTLITGEHLGKKWRGWEDPISGETWKPFRVPWNAMSKPTFDDSAQTFDLSAHAEAIGMTGWNWEDQKSIFFAYDFDSIVGHSEKHTAKLTSDELEEVLINTKLIPWVTVTKSTGGNGYHVFVELKTPVETENHNEHAALARAILGMMSALAGFDFNAKVDICGGNTWVWSRRSRFAENAFKVIKEGHLLDAPPANWRDHIRVTTNNGRRKTRPRHVQEGQVSDFEDLSFRNQHVPLDDDHKKLIKWLADTKSPWEFDQDHHMLVTHTKKLQNAHIDLGLKGYFKTDSEGKNMFEQNCFAFPQRNGAWVIRRFSQGCSEHPSWLQDNGGWTRAYLNKECDLSTACRAFGGIENKKGDFVFAKASEAQKAAGLLGCKLNIPELMADKETILSKHKDGRLVIDIEKSKSHEAEKIALGDWSTEGKKPWTKIMNARLNVAEENDVDTHDDLIRAVANDQQSLGWVAHINNKWINEPLVHIKELLKAQGVSNQQELSQIIGDQILKSWLVVNQPFDPEYPGDRKWNRHAARFRFKPSAEGGAHPTWDKILQHCGKNLDEAIRNDPWCKVNGVATGYEYLRLWCASLFQKPMVPLPYLFLYSDAQNTGKSSLPDALSRLMINGYARADLAINNGSGFNGELEGKVLCGIEEVSFKGVKDAVYNRIKDYVTSPYLNIRHLHQTAYLSPNSTHWIQTSNDFDACPAFTGDTRITFIKVSPLDTFDLIPRPILINLLDKEAPNFLADLLETELPKSGDRLGLPIITTNDKRAIQDCNKSSIRIFADEHCESIPGVRVTFSEVYNAFIDTLSPNECTKWSNKKFSKEFGTIFEKGKDPRDGKIHFINMKLVGKPLIQKRLKDKVYKIVYTSDVAHITEV